MQRRSKFGQEREEKYFLLSGMLTRKVVGVEMLNEGEFLRDGQKMFDVLNPKIRGFQHFNLHQKPVFIHRRRLGRKPLDFEQVSGFWMLSKAGKNLIDEICSDSVELLAGELVFEDGSDARQMWLCDVTLVLDALNEEESKVNILKYGEKQYVLLVPKPRDLVFIHDVIGNSQIFRLKYAVQTVMCGAKLKEGIKKHGLKGAMFSEIGYRLSGRALCSASQ